jgi:uncharacterized protein YbcI
MSDALEPIQPGTVDDAGSDGGGDKGASHSMLAEVSRAMVKLYKEQFGRGPVRARSDWAGDDVLLCVLEDSFTPAEQNLREMGDHQRLRDIRMLFQYSSLRAFIEPVERVTGRTVRAFVSGIDSEEDVSTETFVFYPRGEEGPSRRGTPEA